MMNSEEKQELELLISIFPQKLKDYIETHFPTQSIQEVVLDLGRVPELRYRDQIERLEALGNMTQDDIDYVVQKVGQFNTDNRAGLPRTLHRISAIRNRHADIIGLTCRIGRAILGGADMIRDQIETGKNILLLGPPGIGKTTLLREVARIESTEMKKRVIVVDTSNEIAGDGDIPHPAIGWARRMQVPSPDQQHAVMIEAVENHMPQVIIVDEIGTEQEALAARTIAERGIQLVATAHGKTLQNLIKNPTLSDLVGGVQSVVLGDEEAKFRGTQKTVLERKSLPTFDVLIEIQEREVFALYQEVMTSVDALLRKEEVQPQIRRRSTDNTVLIQDPVPFFRPEAESPLDFVYKTKIFPYGINTSFLSAAIQFMGLDAEIASVIREADIVLTVKSQLRANSKLQQILHGQNCPVHVLKTNTDAHIEKFLREFFRLSSTTQDLQEEAIAEVTRLAKKALSEHIVVEASPRNQVLRDQQKATVKAMGLNAQSVGVDSQRRLRIYPPHLLQKE